MAKRVQKEATGCGFVTGAKESTQPPLNIDFGEFVFPFPPKF